MSNIQASSGREATGYKGPGALATPQAGGGSIGGERRGPQRDNRSIGGASSGAVPTRARRKQFSGTVVSAGTMARTITVVIERLPWHPKVKKQIRRRTKLLVDDPRNEARVGDQVVIEETRPLSKRKHFRLLRIVSRSPSARVESESGERAAGLAGPELASTMQGKGGSMEGGKP